MTFGLSFSLSSSSAFHSRLFPHCDNMAITVLTSPPLRLKSSYKTKTFSNSPSNVSSFTLIAPA